MTIGVKNFNMKINVKKEQDKMKKSMRKIGDRSGIGCEEPTTSSKKKAELPS